MREGSPNLARLWIVLIAFAGYGAFMYAEMVQGNLDKPWIELLPYFIAFMILSFAFFYAYIGMGIRMKNPWLK